MDILFSDSVLKVLAEVVLALVGLAVAKFVKDQNKAKVDATIEDAIRVAFHVVEDISKRTPNKIDDKVALGLKALEQVAAAKKVKVTDDHKELAKLRFQALHAEGKK